MDAKLPSAKITARDSTSPVDDTWRLFANFLKTIRNKHVPSKMTSVRFHQPWDEHRNQETGKGKEESLYENERFGKPPAPGKTFTKSRKERASCANIATKITSAKW